MADFPTSGDDLIDDTPFDDVMDALAGDDVIRGTEGNDRNLRLRRCGPTIRPCTNSS